MSPAGEKKILENLFRYLGGNYWTDNTGWLDDTVPHCDWFGIECNGPGGKVIGITLGNNNVTGDIGHIDDDHGVNLWGFLTGLEELTKLDLSNNNLSGRLDEFLYDDWTPYNLPRLGHFDISGNNLCGHAPMWFSAPISYVNISHNNFTSISFRRSISSHKSIEVLDLSNNNIAQDVSSVLRNITPHLVNLDLSNNAVTGAFPETFPALNMLQEFSVANNRIDGRIPDLSRATPLIRKLDLSNQQSTTRGGLNGMIPSALSKLDDLIELHLAGNNLSGSIPTQFGNFLQLKVLNISSNNLTSSIPVQLGRLDGECT